jgi:hypothetical protein
VLDQAADRQRADTGRRAQLGRGEPVRGGLEHAPLLGEEGEQTVALVGDRAGVGIHVAEHARRV